MGAQATPPNFVGAVLTGGASRRMGTDKALIEVDGAAMAARVAWALADAGATQVTCLGGNEPALRALGLTVRPDPTPGFGPVGGICDALTWANDVPLLVAPCDLLAPTGSSFRALYDAAERHPGADVVLATFEARHQYAVGIWRPSAHPAVRSAFDGGERSVRGAIANLIVAYVEVAASLAADADTPADLAVKPPAGPCVCDP